MIEILRSNLTDSDVNTNTRYQSIADLLQIRDERAIEILLAAFDRQTVDIYKCFEYFDENNIDRQSIASLIDILETGLYRNRGVFIKALGTICCKKANIASIVAFQSQICWLRLKAIRILGRAKHNESVDILIESLQDRDSKIRKYAARALGLIGDEKALDSLVIALKDPCNGVKISAALALGFIGSERAIEPLIKALRSVCHQTREEATHSLIKICGLNSKIASRIILQSEHCNTIYIVYRSMYEMRLDPRITMEVISNALEHPNPKVRQASIDFNYLNKLIFLQIDTQDKFNVAIDLLIQGLQHKDISVRIGIIRCLTEIPIQFILNNKLDIVTSLLIAGIDRRNSMKQKYEIRALGSIGKSNAIMPLLNILREQGSYRTYNPDWDRKVIVQSLNKIIDRVGNSISIKIRESTFDLLTLITTDEKWMGQDLAKDLLAKIESLN